MKIAITDASGFVGNYLCNALLSLDHEISVLTRKVEFPMASVKAVKGNLLSDGENLQALVDGVDAIYHCAGEIKDESLMVESHIGGTRCILDAVRESIKKNRKPVHWMQLSLTHDRIDALVKRTYYPFEKIEKTPGVVPRHSIPEAVLSMFRK